MLYGLERDNVTRTDGRQISVLYLGTGEDHFLRTLRRFPPELMLIAVDESGGRRPCHFAAGVAQQRPIDLMNFVPVTAPACVASHWVK